MAQPGRHAEHTGQAPVKNVRRRDASGVSNTNPITMLGNLRPHKSERVSSAIGTKKTSTGLMAIGQSRNHGHQWPPRRARPAAHLHGV